MPRPHLPAALAGLLGVALNVLAVGALREIPHTYRPSDVPAWLAETVAHPAASTLSAWAFTVGLISLAAFAAGLAFAARTSWAVVGASLFGLGAMLDAAGTMAPLAALHLDAPTGLGLLWMSLLLDSAFNGLLGLGLLCFALGLPADWPRAHRLLAVAAGLASLPVALQFHSDDFARLLALAGPLWLVWVTWASVLLLRRERG